MVHGHLLTKSHGVVGYGEAETVAVATNSLFHATFYLNQNRKSWYSLKQVKTFEASQNVSAALQEGLG